MTVIERIAWLSYFIVIAILLVRLFVVVFGWSAVLVVAIAATVSFAACVVVLVLGGAA